MVMRSILLSSLTFGLVAAGAVGAAPAPDIFITPQSPATIYRDGWIDLNKNGVKDPYEDPALEVDQRIDDLIARMTPDEKTAQMVTLYGFPRILKDEIPTEKWTTSFWKDGIGNIDEQATGYAASGSKLPFHYLLPYSAHAKQINDVQRFFIEKTRLGIPVDFTNEGIRGLLHQKATSFPAELAVGCTWDKELVHEIGATTGSEARALGYTNVYSPVLDLSRDPRWGRVPETYGEDPFLVSEMGMAEVRGIQEQHVVSTLKHFAIYSVPKGGRDGEARTDPEVTWREVEQVFLMPFRKCVRDAGALGVMVSYNDYDGIPIESNPAFLTDILRREWGFKGYVVSDSGAVEFVHSKHRVAATPAEAVRQSVEAGLDIRTHVTGQPEVFATPLRELVKSGAIAMTTIDARVRDILRVKYGLGLFDQPYQVDPAKADQVVRSPAHMAAAARAARESLVLLKNEGNALPLRKDLKKVLVAGPLADNAKAAWYSRYGPQGLDYVSVLAGVKRKLGADAEVKFVEGCAVADGFPESDVYKEPPSDEIRARISAAAEAAKGMDVAIVVLGETDQICSESHSRMSLNLPGYQEELLQAIQATGVPTVLVLTNGRPLSINWAVKHTPAILETWFPGEQGGDAIADVLFGDYNPGGRLSITFPRSVGQVPYNFPAKPGSQGKDQGMVQGPLFPFGYGLSYTKFDYANLRISPERQVVGSNVEVACDVTNRGDRAGDEVVQLYLRDDYSSVITYEKVLRGFERIHLAPGETKTVKFTLTPEHMALYDRNHQWTVEAGRFTIGIGGSSEDTRLRGTFTITNPDGSAPEEGPVRESRVDPL
jgi:beta-glucosidase